MNSSGDETRPRKLLLNKKELKKIKESIKVKRYTIIPTILK
jgi:tmRNA-binding protein